MKYDILANSAEEAGVSIYEVGHARPGFRDNPCFHPWTLVHWAHKYLLHFSLTFSGSSYLAFPIPYKFTNSDSFFPLEDFAPLQ